MEFRDVCLEYDLHSRLQHLGTLPHGAFEAVRIGADNACTGGPSSGTMWVGGPPTHGKPHQCMLTRTSIGRHWMTPVGWSQHFHAPDEKTVFAAIDCSKSSSDGIPWESKFYFPLLLAPHQRVLTTFMCAAWFWCCGCFESVWWSQIFYLSTGGACLFSFICIPSGSA